MNAPDLSLRAHVERLAQCREDAERAEMLLAEERKQFDMEHAALIGIVKARRVAVDEADAAVRGLALIAHDQTGTKAPADGVKIVTRKNYEIDEVAGLAWARQTQMCLVPESLDVKAVKTLASVQALPFVRVEDVPSVQIASDLSAVVVPQERAA